MTITDYSHLPDLRSDETKETDRLRAEIASLRSQVESYRDLAGEQQTKWATRCTTAEAEVASLRAELADESPGTPLGRLNAIAVAAKERGLCTGVEAKPAEVFLIEAFDALRTELAETRRDTAERVVLLGGERDYLRSELISVKETFNTAIRSRDSVISGLRTECERLRAELAEVKTELNIAWSTAKVEAGLKDKARAAARQDAEEKARLREALEPFSKLGGANDMQAYHDLEDDVVVYKSAGEAITAGEVRLARKLVLFAKGQPISEMHFRKSGAALACTPAGVPNGVQQTEEIVRLREALTLALDFIKGIGVTPKPKWWGSARAALACRSQGEKS